MSPTVSLKIPSAVFDEPRSNFSSADAGKFALRLTQVGLEEMQRLVLVRVVEFASLQLREALRRLT